jgi:phenylalanine-4-hydroxylase
MELLPQHLKKFVVNQDDKKYSPRDQAVWRYILRQLKTYLSEHAHPFYSEGLKQTGITIDSIPQISHISEMLSRFGWRASPVSGFIPPAAFMEMQALSVLPIASDMRPIDQLLYTPAPDIVHEAAGHAPMLAQPEYAAYLQEYAQVAKNAIISREDLDIYEAIRILSDVKAIPGATAEDIKAAENKLELAVKNISHTSEATQLSRMNWWTAEYGLIGSLENPKIYGAGLLSSVGEARWCLSDKVKKIPLTIDCINYTYDITEPQPQLFVTPDFKTLSKVLEEFANTMAFRKGGLEGLEKAARAKTVNTVELNSGVQISGQVIEFIRDTSGQVAFFKMQGPSQLSFNRKELKGHSKAYHNHGYSSPVGHLKAFPFKCPSELTEAEWKKIGVQFSKKQSIKLEYTSGIVVTGEVISSWNEKDRCILISLENAKAMFNDKVLFDPSWGTYDVVLGSTVTSVFGGPADRVAYGETDNFVVAKVPEAQYSEIDYRAFGYYQILRDIREGKKTLYDLDSCVKSIIEELPKEWLLVLESLEIALATNQKKLEEICRTQLAQKNYTESEAQCIREGIAIAHETKL